MLKIAVYAYDDGGPVQVLKTAAPEFESAAAYPIATGERLARRSALSRRELLDLAQRYSERQRASADWRSATRAEFRRAGADLAQAARPGETFRHDSSALQESAFARCL